MPLIAVAAITAAGSIASGLIGSHAANSAANTEAAAAQQAGQQAQTAAQTSNALVDKNETTGQNLVSTAATQANGTLGGIYQQDQTLLAPYQQVGAQAAGTLATDLGSGGSLTTPFTASMMDAYDPGYQFRLQQGQQALERSAAARGTQLSGGTLKDLASYEQGLASSEYQNAFSRYMAQQQQTYGMLSNTASLGNTAAAQGLQAGEWYGSTASGNLTNSAAQQAQLLQGSASLQSQNNMTAAQIEGNDTMAAANAKAAGTIGSANAWTGAIGGATNSLTNYMALSQVPSFTNSTLPALTTTDSVFDPNSAYGSAVAPANPTVLPPVPTASTGYQAPQANPGTLVSSYWPLTLGGS